MNLVFRLFKVLFRFFILPRRIGILEESRVRFRVWPSDLDTNGHMNNGRYLTLMDLGRLDLLLRTGAVRVAVKHRWYPVLAATQVRFRRPLNLFQKFEISTRIAGWDGKWVFLEQKIIRGDFVILHAYLKGVFVGKQGSVAITELLTRMGITQPPPPLPESLAGWLRAERAMAENP